MWTGESTRAPDIHLGLSYDIPGFAKVLDLIFALDGMMNLSLKDLKGSLASSDWAYSLVFVLASERNEGFAIEL